MLKNFSFILTITILGMHPMLWAADCPTKKFIRNYEKWDANTGDVKKHFRRSKMYELMVEGASDSSGSIVFVDENDWGNQKMLAQYPELNKSLFKQYNSIAKKSGDRGKYAASFDYKGIFKISYKYNAKECRRQIILGKHLRKKNGESRGAFNGFTAVEICNPMVAQLFGEAKKALGSGNMPSIDEFMAFVEKLFNMGKIDRTSYYQIAQNLEMNKTQKKSILYFKDEDGDILPRFAVKIKSFQWEEFWKDRCTMVIDHDDNAQDYAGLASSFSEDYTWSMEYTPETPSDEQLWYWDLNDYKPGDKHGTDYNYVEVIDGI